ncbi:hypothetical protein FOQG_18200 [Fusarium oxysporum f. sp. raphani 54005]|uniref:Uncharacterized protein n=1 Tax=Fusarium oxysporum f. sp. raphani 54005 TaxID=1089458 RepID=X0B5N9_FUSOX|nr:hypothetical protein FOQG_18200 [Fusarium oxysporum f. sp. raphani 54005]
MPVPPSRYESTDLVIFNPEDERNCGMPEAVREYFNSKVVPDCTEPTQEQWKRFTMNKGSGYERTEFLVRQVPFYRYRPNDGAAVICGLSIAVLSSLGWKWIVG